MLQRIILFTLLALATASAHSLSTLQNFKNQHDGSYGEQFAVAAVVEISLAIKLNFKGMNTIPLSAQEIIDCQPAFCEKYWSQCTGTPIQKLMWYPHYKGLSGETGYPYNNPPVQGTCRSEITVGFIGVPIVSPGNSEETLKQLLVDNGAAIVSVYFSNSLLSEYASGVYPGSDCGSNAPNQVLTLVGYGNEGGQDYWLLKNSRGQRWGEQGYLRLARNGGNVCGILVGPAYAAKYR